MERNALAQKLELIGSMFEIDGMQDLLSKFSEKMDTVKFSAVLFQIEGKLLDGNQATADKLIAANMGISEEEIGKMDDGKYAGALKNAILTDVMGFFASSPRQAGQK